MWTTTDGPTDESSDGKINAEKGILTNRFTLLFPIMAIKDVKTSLQREIFMGRFNIMITRRNDCKLAVFVSITRSCDHKDTHTHTNAQYEQ